MPSMLSAIDAYIAKSAPFAQPILIKWRDTVHSAIPDVDETIKWGMPFFVYKGIILTHMAAFKQHCGFGIWQEDARSIAKPSAVEADGGGGMGGLGKVKSLSDLPATKDLKRLMVEAARKIDSGERVSSMKRSSAPKKARPAAIVPDVLAAALKKNRAANLNFAAMSPSCQREYCEWITEAKREETRDKRVATAVEWIGEGKSRHWKYQNC